VKLNWVEFGLMNNPVRAFVQRRVEAARLLRMGGRMEGGTALEIGCGRGVGAALILDAFGAEQVDAFDLDPRMVRRARQRLGSRARLWVGDAERLPLNGARYDAVVDFGILHHVPRWREALLEVARVLKPGGRFYAEEVLGGFIRHPLTKLFVEHPQEDRFDAPTFRAAMEEAGLAVQAQEEWRGAIAWWVAVKG
jgi:ubiquinone/menaquinone biosynthesis C-methylase UbiE